MLKHKLFDRCGYCGKFFTIQYEGYMHVTYYVYSATLKTHGPNRSLCVISMTYTWKKDFHG